jgi:hypothetical protein
MSKQAVKANKGKEENYGHVIMECRESLGWSREFLAELYGHMLRERQVTTKAIEKMEKYNDVPRNPLRRVILAGLLGLAPAALGLHTPEQTLETLITPHVKKGPINVVEYRSTLQTYQSSIVGSGYGDSTWKIIDDCIGRIYALHDKVLYVGKEQRSSLFELLCGFHLTVAEVAQEHRYYNDATAYFNRALILAKMSQQPQIQATILRRRGVYFLDKRDNNKANGDFQQALTLERLPLQLKGLLMTGNATSQSRIAQYKLDITGALDDMDDATTLQGQTIEDETYLRKFDEERWHLDRAAVLMGSPLKKCRFPDEAIKELSYVCTTPNETRRFAYRQIYSNILQAYAYIDKGEFSFSTKLAQDALGIMGEIGSYAHTPDIVNIYEVLKGTNGYGNSKAVAELGVDLLKTQYPDLFS